MSDTDEDHVRQDDDRASASAAARRRRTRIAVGVAGLAAVLGAGGYLLTDNASRSRTDAADVGDVPPAVDAAGAPVSASAGVAMADAVSVEPDIDRPSVSMSLPPSVSADVADKIRKAREDMARHGVKVKRPVEQKSPGEVSDVRESTQGSLNDGGIVRLVTAHGDLTGQRELGWVAGGVSKHRGVPCSQTIKTSADVRAEKKPNLLICWRTSATRSVISVLVDPKGHPSRDRAVDSLLKKWNALK